VVHEASDRSKPKTDNATTGAVDTDNATVTPDVPIDLAAQVAEVLSKQEEADTQARQQDELRAAIQKGMQDQADKEALERAEANVAALKARVAAAEKDKSSKAVEINPGTSSPRPLEPTTEVNSIPDLISVLAETFRHLQLTGEKGRNCACAQPECVLM